eukprot:m.871235 g.871235  ORF g.871235 m.871235 type:complete len:895 (-) comp59761_c1_seq4:1897-4581(-)
MSEATKRKYVAQEILTDFPEPAPPQKIAQILASRGGNLHEYLDQDGLKAICSMPSKFRKNVWIKRGDFVILDPISEGDKVKSEITSILYADQIRHLKKCNLWPEAFEKVDVDGPKKADSYEMELPPSDEEEEEEEEEEDGRDNELHFNEPWYHAKLKGGRVAAEALLKAVNGEEGTFLIRESDTFPGEFSLSFMKNTEGKMEVQHCRIRCANNRYFLTDQVAFMNLYELVEYHRREPLRSIGFKVALKDACPQPAPHEDKKWFHRDQSRSQAEDMLKRIHNDGAFLIRESLSAQQAFAISFRAEGKIKHCRIRKEGRMYCIGDAEFDTLVKLVEFYEKHPLYRKMKLRYPVDEELLARLNVQPEEEDIYNSESLYQEPNAVIKSKTRKSNIVCRALYAFNASRPDELSFPKDAIITGVIKQDGEWWQGDYGGMSGAFFPMNFAEEVELDSFGKEEEEDNLLGTLEKSFLSVHSLRPEPRTGTPNQRFVFRITDDSNGQHLDCAAESEAEMGFWIEKIKEAAKASSERQQVGRMLQSKLRIHLELSDLIFYAQSVTFKSFEDSRVRPFYVMSSFMEKKAMMFAVATERGGQPTQFNHMNKRQLSRIYPNGKRVDSSNYDPQPLWNVGVQLVALNYQTPDKPMWLNSGRFLDNGRCGYVLKPDIMMDPTFNAFQHDTYSARVDGLTITIQVLGARHLLKPVRGIVSPFVEVEICGTENDSTRYKTKTVSDNGFYPAWMDVVGGKSQSTEVVVFKLGLPDVACLRFVVYDEDVFGDANPIAQAVLPIGNQRETCLRSGYRSVPLKNLYNEPLELSALLIHITLSYGRREEYQSLDELRDQLRKQMAQRDDIITQKVRANKKGATAVDAGSDLQLKQVNKTVNELQKKLGDLTVKGSK